MRLPQPIKVCTKCHAPLPATPDFFYRDASQSDGIKQPCKNCCKVKYEESREERLTYSRQYYQSNRERRLSQTQEWRKNNKERVREIARRWAFANPGKVNERSRRWRARHPEEVREINRQWRINNARYFSSMHKAHHAIEIAIHRGEIKRPLLCEGCGMETTIQAHHYKGYAQKYHLTVQWLCQNCHVQAHRR